MAIALEFKKSAASFNESDLAIFGGGEPARQTLSESIVQLPLRSLVPWMDRDGKEQPFKPYSEDRLRQLAEDIRENGILSPLIVRPYGAGRYQILAGHNRWKAGGMAGLETVPAIIREADDDAAALIMVNTNLNQRDMLLPSEKAWAYRMQLEAMKRRAGRPKNNSAQNERNSHGRESRDILAQQTGENRNQIQRYIRLTYLIPDLLEMVDNDMLPMLSGVSLSYLLPEHQQIVCDVSADCTKRISTAQSDLLRRLPQSEFSEAAVRDILLPIKPWNAANEFVSRSRRLIPNSATVEDIEAIADMISAYFEGR